MLGNGTEGGDDFLDAEHVGPDSMLAGVSFRDCRGFFGLDTGYSERATDC
jgi:hypothetical protein